MIAALVKAPWLKMPGCDVLVIQNFSSVTYFPLCMVE